MQHTQQWGRWIIHLCPTQHTDRPPIDATPLLPVLCAPPFPRPQPAWEDRLSEEEIAGVAEYVYQTALKDAW